MAHSGQPFPQISPNSMQPVLQVRCGRMFVQIHMPTRLKVCTCVRWRARNLVLEIKSWGLPWEFWPQQCICTLQLVQTACWDGRPCEAGLGSDGWGSPLVLPQPCCAKSLQSCPALCNPMDCSPPGSSVHEILQARILEWVAMPSSRGSSPPKEGTSVSYVSCIGRRVLYH